MGATSEWDVGCDEGVSEIVARSQEFGNRPELLSDRPPTPANPTKEARNEFDLEWARVASIHRPADYESAVPTGLRYPYLDERLTITNPDP